MRPVTGTTAAPFKPLPGKPQGQTAADFNFQADAGVLFKHKLAISPEGVQYGTKLFPLDTITRARWGAVLITVNVIPTVTTYTMSFGDDQHLATARTHNKSIFDQFIAHFWEAVGSRMFMEMLAELRQGQKLHFGHVVVSDGGIDMLRHHLLEPAEFVLPGGRISALKTGQAPCI